MLLLSAQRNRRNSKMRADRSDLISIPFPISTYLRVAVEVALPLPLHVLGDVALLRELDPVPHLLEGHEAVAVLKEKERAIIIPMALAVT